METRSGRKWRVAAEDIYGGCLWDHTPTKAEINAGVALECAYAGCETGWVCTQFHLLLSLNLTLIGPISSGMHRTDACRERMDV